MLVTAKNKITGEVKDYTPDEWLILQADSNYQFIGLKYTEKKSVPKTEQKTAPTTGGCRSCAQKKLKS